MKKNKFSMKSNFKKPEVVLVLPVFSTNLSFLKIINDNCTKLAVAMPDVNWTVIIINDGSIVVPRVNEMFQNLSADINYYYYHYKTNKGKGHAVRFGFHKAQDADIFIYSDYDFPFGTKAVIKTVNILRRKDADIVAGDRGIHYLSFLPFSRKIITVLARIVNAKIFRLNFTDTQAGLKAMNNRGVPVILQTTINGFLFDLQFVKDAEQQGLKIHALPVNSTKDIQLKNFRMSIICTEIKNLLGLIFKKRDTENRYSSY
jgi:glycosyltransferase involved in cell wall biosynthesis